MRIISLQLLGVPAELETVSNALLSELCWSQVRSSLLLATGVF